MDPEVIETTETPEPSLRETLEDAIQEHDPDLTGASAAPAESTPPPDADSAAAPVSTEQPVPVPAAPETPLQAGKEAVSPAPTPASTELKAPAQWKPAIREEWPKLPRAVQEEVLRREADSMRLIGSVGPKIRMADEISQHIAPFAESLTESGMSPSAFVADIFDSIKVLARGTPQERAETVANIVQSYGVDLPTLDRILTARISAPPEVLQARIATARANAVIHQQTSSVEHQTAMDAERSIVAFAADPKHEFIDDVRNQMADLIELGHAKSLEDAYQSAIWSNPDTRKILLTREAQSRAAVKTTRAVAARKASSSVRGAPSVPGAASNGASGGTLRETIAAAFDEASPL